MIPEWNIRQTTMRRYDATIQEWLRGERSNVSFSVLPMAVWLEYQYVAFGHGDLSLGKTLFWNYSKEKVELYKRRMLSGRWEFKPFVIAESMQDGRHRTIAMIELGVKEVPVYFIH